MWGFDDFGEFLLLVLGQFPGVWGILEGVPRVLGGYFGVISSVLGDVQDCRVLFCRDFSDLGGPELHRGFFGGDVPLFWGSPGLHKEIFGGFSLFLSSPGIHKEIFGGDPPILGCPGVHKGIFEGCSLDFRVLQDCSMDFFLGGDPSILGIQNCTGDFWGYSLNCRVLQECTKGFLGVSPHFGVPSTAQRDFWGSFSPFWGAQEGTKGLFWGCSLYFRILQECTKRFFWDVPPILGCPGLLGWGGALWPCLSFPQTEQILSPLLGGSPPSQFAQYPLPSAPGPIKPPRGGLGLGGVP